MAEMRTFDLYKWCIYIGAVVLIAFNGATLYHHATVTENISGAMMSIFFMTIGVVLIIKERRSVKQQAMNRKFSQLTGQFDGDMQRAIRFVLINAHAFGGPKEEWIELASDVFEKEPTRLERALDELEADMEYLTRTGDLPGE